MPGHCQLKPQNDFKKDLRLSGPEGWAACGPLWRAVGPCGRFVLALLNAAIRKLHSAVQVDCNLQDGRLQGIAVMADWSLQDCKVLVNDNVIQHALALEEVGGY